MTFLPYRLSYYQKALLSRSRGEGMTEKELAEYINKFHGTVFRLSYSYVKNREDAEDVCQEAFLKLYRSEQLFAADENVKAWLLRVAVNLSKNLLKSSWFARRVELSDDIPAENPREQALLSSIKALPPKYGGILHLFYYEGYGVKEIADIEGISVSAVTTRLSRARKLLKEMLLKEGYDES